MLSSSTVDLSAATYDYRKDTLYATKGVAVVCGEALVHAATAVLTAMHQYVCRTDCDINVLEGLIGTIMYDVPIPNPGRSVRFWCLGDAMTISMPKVPKELPLFDYSFLEFFHILGVENAIKLVTCVLLEHQVLVYSSEVDKLMLVCESATALMYPFAWPHVYVPILPPNLENFLDAPVPYMMGLLRRAHDIELSKKGSVCIVDIDNGEIELPEELPEFPYEKELAEELKSNIARFGGKEGADIMKEHAIEILETSSANVSGNTSNSQMIHVDPNNPTSAAANILDNSDTMEELNRMISKFEQLSEHHSSTTNTSNSSSKIQGPAKAGPASADRLRVNNSVRETVTHRFAHMFHSFEHFVIFSSGAGSDSAVEMGDEEDEDEEEGMPQRNDCQHNFDKTSFLSDQKQSHLPFLSSFLETQTFSSFIDGYIQEVESGTPGGFAATPFGLRLQTLKGTFTL